MWLFWTVKHSKVFSCVCVFWLSIEKSMHWKLMVYICNDYRALYMVGRIWWKNPQYATSLQSEEVTYIWNVLPQFLLLPCFHLIISVLCLLGKSLTSGGLTTFTWSAPPTSTSPTSAFSSTVMCAMWPRFVFYPKWRGPVLLIQLDFKQVDLVTIVSTATQHVGEREIIRGSWGRPHMPGVVTR